MSSNHNSVALDAWSRIEGSVLPLGTTWVASELGYNFSIYSKNATAVSLSTPRNDPSPQIFLAPLLNVGDFVLGLELSGAKSSVDMKNGVADEVIFDECENSFQISFIGLIDKFQVALQRGSSDGFESRYKAVFEEQGVEGCSQMCFVRERHEEVVNHHLRNTRVVASYDATDLGDVLLEFWPTDELSKRLGDPVLIGADLFE